MARSQTPVGAPKVDPVPSDHRRRLEDLRDVLTDAIREAGTRDKAPLAGQLRAVLVELAALPTVTEVDAVDDLAAARSRRRSGSALVQHPASG